MTIKARVARMMFAVTVVISALAGVVPARATHDCPLLSEGYNDLSGPAYCYALDVPDGVDLLRVASGDGYLYVGEVACSWYSWSDNAGKWCAIPGPEAGHYWFGRGAASWINVRFEEAKPVTGAALGSTSGGPQDGAMFRFDGLEHTAIISLTGSPDLDLRARRGASPTFEQADCVSAERSVQTGNPSNYWLGARGPGVEDCRLEAGDGPIYAFITWHWSSGMQVWVPASLGCPYRPTLIAPYNLLLNSICSSFSIAGADA